MGNGPGLTQTLNDPNDYNFIVNKDICVVNAFPADEHFFILKPKYLVIMDPAYFVANQAQIVIKQINDICDNLSNIDWKLTFFMPMQAKQNNVFRKRLKENKYIRYI